MINASITGESMGRGWIVSLGGENNDVVQIDEISEDKLEEMSREGIGFLNVECIAIVGMIDGRLADPQRPNSEPWYMMKVIGCHPNLIVYDGKNEAYYLDNKSTAIDSIIFAHNKFKKGRQVNFNKKQFDDAVQEFLDG